MSIKDAAGRTVDLGDTAGGTSSGRYQATIVGPVVALGADKARIRVTNHATIGSVRPQNGDEPWISASRVFLVAPLTERRFVGFKTPDGVLWTVSPRFKKPLYEAAHITERFTPERLRSTYRGALTPLWDDVQPTPGADPMAGLIARHVGVCAAAGLLPGESRAVTEQGGGRVWAAMLTAVHPDAVLDQALLDETLLNAVAAPTTT